MLQKYNDTCALPGHTMVRLGVIGEAKEPMKQKPPAVGTRQKGRKI